VLSPFASQHVRALAICNLTSKRRSEDASRYIPMSVGVLTPLSALADVSVAACIHRSLRSLNCVYVDGRGAYSGNLALGTGVGSGVGQPAIIAAAARLVRFAATRPSTRRRVSRVTRSAGLLRVAETPEHNLGEAPAPHFGHDASPLKPAVAQRSETQRAVVVCRSGAEV